MMKRFEQKSNSNASSLALVTDEFAKACTKNPNRVAVRFGSTAMRYCDLDKRSNELSAKLVNNGISSGDLVAIGMGRSHNVLVSMLAVWKAGAAFVPLDTRYPEMRLLQILDDAAPRAILTDERNRQQFLGAGSELLVFENLVTGEAAASPTVTISAGDLAYVIFTSGSTGRPKGVTIPHGALSNFLSAIQQSLQLRSSDTLAAVTTLTFDISILETILPLMHGATVAVLDENSSGDGRRLAEGLEHYKATLMQATPATWRLLLDTGWNGNNALTVISGGERLPRPLAEELLRRSRRVFNAYGPTEATIWATLEHVQTGDGPVPIGRALRNYTAVVLNNELAVVAPDEPGQLYLGGGSLAAGYINRPDETQTRFITHPDFGRLYATGDQVREMDNGKLDFLGRVDDQIKINGFRVEPGDVETQLLALPGIKEALVMLRKEGGKLVAYIVPDGTVELTSRRLRSALGTRLPRYMIPHHFVQLASFPKTSNNKVDRQQLPAPDVPGSYTNETIEDPLEAYLQSVWAEVLGISAIGAGDNFFDIGGDSLQAAQVTNRVEELLREIVWPVILFDAPTITEFAAYLRRTYPAAITRRNLSRQTPACEAADRAIDEKKVNRFTSLMKPLAPFPAPTAKNPPALFVLCPPRSGSTLLRAILAGHPNLFAPPEIELLTFNTMHERAEMYSGRESYRREGAIRAVMAIKDCGVEESRAILSNYENARTTIPEFYGIMQSWLPGRLLVDKTPANTLDLAALRRIENYFEDPIYIHLTRHPQGMIRSFLEARLSAVFFRRTSHGFSPRELAELIWFTSHDNTLTALASVPTERQFTLSFETLTRTSEETVLQLCDFLAIECHPDMLRPWENKKNKMTDGLHPESKMMGDPKFHGYRCIDASVAERWRDQLQNITLGEPTRKLALELGYTDFGNDSEQGEREEFVL